MTAIQPTLDGSIPQPSRPRMDDYEEWLDHIRPTFASVAATGRRFKCWEVKVEYHLPDPPDPDHQWGDAMGAFRREGLIRRDGWGETRDGSGVRAWRGTRAAMRTAPAEGRAAA